MVACVMARLFTGLGEVDLTEAWADGSKPIPKPINDSSIGILCGCTSGTSFVTSFVDVKLKVIIVCL